MKSGSVWMFVVGGVVLAGGALGAVLMSRGGTAPSEYARAEFINACQAAIKAKVARPQSVEFVAANIVDTSSGMRWSGKMSYQDSANTVYSGSFSCTDENGTPKLEFQGLGGVFQ